MQFFLSDGTPCFIDEADYSAEFSTQLAGGAILTGRPCAMSWQPFIRRKTCYAVSRRLVNGVYRKVLLHRLLLQTVPGQIVDHRDCNGLNNRRDNLRLATLGQNGFNRRKSERKASAYKGVSKHKNRWRAYCARAAHDGGRRTYHHLGLFANEIDAALAYDRAALAEFGEFARLNFPEAMVKP